MKKHIVAIMMIGLLFMSDLLCAQNNEQISSSLQKEIIKELSILIEREYVLEDVGSKMATHLNSLNNKVSTADMGSEAFIKFINKELSSVYVDKHLALINPDKFKQLRKMFGLDEEDVEIQKKEHHTKPENQTSHNTHGDKKEYRSHAKPKKNVNHNNQGDNEHNSHANTKKQTNHSAHTEGANELAGSRVINRDGRTNIGLMKLNRFDGSEKGLKNMKNLFNSFIGVDAIIIDLRKCKGGDANMVKALSGYFFDTPTYLVSTIGRKDKTDKRKTTERWTSVNEFSKEFGKTPLYIMTSVNTFSAAESFSFGLKLNKRAILVGENTGGGGHMNTFFALPGGYGAAISVGRTFDGKTGEGFQSKGVQADVQIEANHAFSKTLELIEKKRTEELAYNESKEKVYQALQKLSEAWYSGDFKSAEPLIYTKCRAYLSINNKSIVNEVELLKFIKDGTGTKTPREVRNREISIYEVRNNKTAIARLMFRDQIHYIHLINDNDSWKILSDLITMKQKHG